ncbi:unnamed protein product [Rotaria sp. Silwood1]|nr:unnamed protein product [Rotaria sp. Silwood1]CAF4684130.1 unnamed protein product [Rotaria sp. Silwood1]
MSPKHHTLKATYSYQNPGFQSNINDRKLQYRRTVSYNDYYTLEQEQEQEQKSILPSSSSSSPIAHVLIPIPELTVPIIDRNITNGRQRFRWNLMFNVLVWLICPLPIWLPFISNKIAIFLLTSIQCIFVLIWFIITLLAARNAFIIFHCYKEPLELIKRSIDTLAAQSEVNRISMIISFEERTPDVHTKCQTLQNYYAQAGFRDLIFTIHPYGLANEIPGKCSNANYALRTAIKQLKLDENENENDNHNHTLITTCDADSQFHPHYIAALTYQYIKDNYPALTTIYQPPLFYNWNLDASSFFTRITGLLRSTLMLGALIPFSINTMSIFSFSLSLAKAGNFVHPAYQMDDIICLIRWMGATGRRLSIKMVLTPVISGPTCGRTIEYEFMEWTRQARRWTIGAAEVFHYFMIKSRRIPFLTSLSWSITFLIYYGVLLCSSGLYGLTYFVAIQFLLNEIPNYIIYITYILLSIQMLSFSVAFIIDIFISRLMNIKQCIFFLRNIFHFLMTPFVLIGYSLVEFYALHEVMIRGKKVCKHGASNKNTLN